MELWGIIDKLMEQAAYKNTFNKVINDALDYGLPVLYNLYFGLPQEENSEDIIEPIKKTNEIIDEFSWQVVRLLKEIIINETINKSLLCSLFQAKSLELNGKAISGKKFEEGSFRDTPNYLTNYEMRSIKDIRK